MASVLFSAMVGGAVGALVVLAPYALICSILRLL